MILRIITLFITVIIYVGIVSDAVSGEVGSEGTRWCEFAVQDLISVGNGSTPCSTLGRCVKMNNYTCTKNPTSSPYQGQATTVGGAPLTDIDKHAIYTDPKWSLIETVNILRAYYIKYKIHSAIEIAERWAPWCDTNGSKQIRQGWGNTCKGIAAPASFRGPLCRKPPDNTPLPGQCGPCNCPNEIADFYVKGTGLTTRDDLKLFDEAGYPTPMLPKILPRVVQMETGLLITPTLAASASAIYERAH